MRRAHTVHAAREALHTTVRIKDSAARGVQPELAGPGVHACCEACMRTGRCRAAAGSGDRAGHKVQWLPNTCTKQRRRIVVLKCTPNEAVVNRQAQHHHIVLGAWVTSEYV